MRLFLNSRWAFRKKDVADFETVEDESLLAVIIGLVLAETPISATRFGV